MGAIVDWILWVVGGLTAVGGLAVAGWALFADRPRRRRRCPKCWYDLTASPGLRCSECGYAASREKALRKTRRHWFPARLATLAAVAGMVLVAVPRLRQGPEKVVPTTVLVMMSPKLDLTWPAGAAELSERLEKGTVWSWQWRWLVDRVSKGRPFCDVTIETNETWPESVELAGEVSCSLDPTIAGRFPRTDHRVRIEPRFDRDAEPLLIPLHRWTALSGPDQDVSPADARHLGLPPRAGDDPLEFDVIVERSRTRPAGVFMILPAFQGEGWQTIHRRRVEVHVNVEGSLEDYIASDESATAQLASETRFVLNNRELVVRPPEIDPAAGVVFPVAIELRRDGEPIAEFLDWWRPGSRRPPASSHAIPLEITGAERPFGTRDYARWSWSVRVCGDASRALLHPDAAGYWSGEFEVGLDLVEHPDLMFTNGTSKLTADR